MLLKKDFIEALSKNDDIVSNIEELEKGEVRFSIIAESGYEFRLKIYPGIYQDEHDLDYLSNLWEFAKFEFNLDRELESFRENKTYSQEHSLEESLTDFEDLKQKLSLLLERLEEIEKENEK